MEVARCGSGHKMSHKLSLIHNAIDALSSIVKQLCGMFEGRTLYVAFTAVEEEVEEQNEDHRDDEHDKQSEAQRKMLLDIAKESFLESAGVLIS